MALNLNEFEFFYNSNFHDSQKWVLVLSTKEIDPEPKILKSKKFDTYEKALEEYEHLRNKKTFESSSIEDVDDNPTILSIYVSN